MQPTFTTNLLLRRTVGPSANRIIKCVGTQTKPAEREVVSTQKRKHDPFILYISYTCLHKMQHRFCPSLNTADELLVNSTNAEFVTVSNIRNQDHNQQYG